MIASTDVGSDDDRFAAVAAQLSAAGLNLTGCLGVDRYDAAVPAAWASAALLPQARTAIGVMLRHDGQIVVHVQHQEIGCPQPEARIESAPVTLAIGQGGGQKPGLPVFHRGPGENG